MAEFNYLPPAAQQLAYLAQLRQRSQTAGDHNPWAAEADLEAYLAHQVLAQPRPPEK